MAANTRTLNDQELAYVLQQYPLPETTAKSIAEHLTAERGDERRPVTESMVFSTIKRVRKNLESQLHQGSDDEELAPLRAALARLEPHRKTQQRKARVRSLIEGLSAR